MKDIIHIQLSINNHQSISRYQNFSLAVLDNSIRSHIFKIIWIHGLYRQNWWIIWNQSSWRWLSQLNIKGKMYIPQSVLGILSQHLVSAEGDSSHTQSSEHDIFQYSTRCSIFSRFDKIRNNSAHSQHNMISVFELWHKRQWAKCTSNCFKERYIFFFDQLRFFFVFFLQLIYFLISILWFCWKNRAFKCTSTQRGSDP